MTTVQLEESLSVDPGLPYLEIFNKELWNSSLKAYGNDDLKAIEKEEVIGSCSGIIVQHQTENTLHELPSPKYDSSSYSRTTDQRTSISTSTTPRSMLGVNSQRTSLDSFATATSFPRSYITAPSVRSSDPPDLSSTRFRNTFGNLLQRGRLPSINKGLVQNTSRLRSIAETVSRGINYSKDSSFDENDWCGRGMHVDFDDDEIIPLKSITLAGTGITASVDIVDCRRVQLARKIVKLPPNRKVTQQILLEVSVLHKLSHAHVVRLVGTYIQKRHFATLLYPAAEINLEEYLQQLQYDTFPRFLSQPSSKFRFPPAANTLDSTVRSVLSGGTLCLTSGLRYLHANNIIHSDIKPANIILKKTKLQDGIRPSSSLRDQEFTMYFCDFGISKMLDPEGESQTEEIRGRTPRYAPPEVMAWESHGRAADIYSLGYVLAEIVTVHSGFLVEDFRFYIQNLLLEISSGDQALSRWYHRDPDNVPSPPYHKNYNRTKIDEWLSICDETKTSKATIKLMINHDPTMRLRLIPTPDGFTYLDTCEHETQKFSGYQRINDRRSHNWKDSDRDTQLTGTTVNLGRT